MKNLKTKKELLKREFFKKDNYVAILNSISDIDKLNDFIENNVGQIISNYSDNDKIQLSYENVPEELKEFFFVMDELGTYDDTESFITINKNHITASDNNKEEVQQFIINSKYNI